MVQPFPGLEVWCGWRLGTALRFGTPAVKLHLCRVSEWGLRGEKGSCFHERTERRSVTGFGLPATKWWAVFKSGYCEELVHLKPAASRHSDRAVYGPNARTNGPGISGVAPRRGTSSVFVPWVETHGYRHGVTPRLDLKGAVGQPAVAGQKIPGHDAFRVQWLPLQITIGALPRIPKIFPIRSQIGLPAHLQ